MSAELIINHNAGFFSCCTVRLTNLIHFFNKEKRVPTTVDWSKQFSYYKKNADDPLEDLNSLYFLNPNNEQILYYKDIYIHSDIQFEPYSAINFNFITPFIKKYFQPSNIVTELSHSFEIKNSINYNKTIGVIYRGNDKHQETGIACYEQFITKCENILNVNSDMCFFLQTDEEEFKNTFLKKFPNTIINNDIPTIKSNKCQAVHDIIPFAHKPFFGALFLSSVVCLSKCHTLITHSGNCGLWATLYRENITNVHQYLNHKTASPGWI